MISALFNSSRFAFDVMNTLYNEHTNNIYE